jgi:type II secretory pathway component PulJ
VTASCQHGPHARARSSGGFSIVELTIAAALLSLLLGVVFSSMQATQKASKTVTRGMDGSRVVETAMRRITEELRSATFVGEDVNNNDVLDSGEDRNGNGRLDADWAVTANSITFNRCMPGNTFSLPVTYRRVGSTLERVAMQSAGGALITTVLARNVDAFAVTAVNSRITITLRVRIPDAGGKTIDRERTAVITPRN